ncbi:MAG: 2-dehydropantoate 2-reductase [Polaromonas sp.]|nr:2-dehydropantoate 2-reductase [Polaromonas sp.]
MKICILGAGALGCALGGVLTEAGNEVWLINRNADQADAMNSRGLLLRDGGVDRAVPVHAATTAAPVGVADLVVVLVKSFHTREAMEAATSLLGPDTAVLSLQNGLGHEDILAEIVGRERVLAGKTYAGGSQLAPGHVLIGTRGKDTHIGELDGSRSERVQRIADTFNAAGLETFVSDNILGTMWDKLLINVATGALSGITRLTYGELYQRPELEACGVAAVAEAMAVAQASGIVLSITDPRDAWRKAGAGLPYAFKTSMLQSLEKGSVTEIDFVNGSVVRWGARCGVPTPVNQTLVACIKGLETSAPTLTASPESAAMPRSQKSYVEHVAVRVKDIQWHIDFFHDVLGMDVREVDGPADAPQQVWTVGGMQLMHTPGFEAPPSNDAGWLAHLGIMVQDLESALVDAQKWGVKELPQGRNWLQLPDGLAVELIQAHGNSVAEALAIQARV